MQPTGMYLSLLCSPVRLWSYHQNKNVCLFHRVFIYLSIHVPVCLARISERQISRAYVYVQQRDGCTYARSH